MRSNRLRLLISTLSILALAACQAKEEKLAEHMSRAEGYVETEEFSAAIIEFKNVLQIDPNHAGAHYGLSNAYLQSNQVREGFWELRESVRLDPENIEARVKLGQFLLMAGDPDEALEHGDVLIEANPDASNGYMIRGQALEVLQRPEEAMEALRKAVEVAGESEETPVILLASALDRSGDREAAEPYFRLYVEKEAGYRAYTALATFLAKDRERADESHAALMEAASRAEPKDENKAHAHVAAFLFQRERFDDAVSYLEDSIEKVEDPLDLIYLLARLHLAQGHDEEADALIKRATTAKPDDPRPHLILSSYLGRKGDIEGAMAAAEDAVAIDPENTDANLRVSEILVDMGFREQDEQKIAKGREIVMGVLEKEPSNPSALVIKAKMDLAEQKVEDAIASLRASIDVNPDLAQAHFILGTALSLQGEKTAARTELARTLEIDPALLEARRLLAQVHGMLGEHEYAVEEGRRYLRERPDSIETRILVAQSLVILQRIDEALVELNQIPEDSRSVEAHYAMGRVQLRRGKKDLARDHLMAAIEMEPTHPDILRSLLRLDRSEGRVQDSIERIDRAIETDPEKGRLRLIRGVIALMENRVEDAEAAFKKAIELDPEDVAGYEHLAQLFSRSGRLQEAVVTYEDAVKVRPEDANLHHLLGVLYQYGGARERSIERYEDAIKYNPDLAEAKNNLAYIYAEAGEQLDRALDLAQEAKASLPDQANVADTLGWVLYKRGVYSAAITYLREAEAAKPGDDANVGEFRYHLAQAYEANDEPQQAREVLERAVSVLDARAEGLRGSGAEAPPEPQWAADVRTMLTRLQQGADSG